MFRMHDGLRQAIGAALTTHQGREKKQNKMEKSGLTQEELIREQEELFANAGSGFKGAPRESV